MLQVAPKSFVEAPPVARARIASLDALRGFNVVWIFGADGMTWALDQMFSDKGPVASGIGHVLGRQHTRAAWAPTYHSATTARLVINSGHQASSRKSKWLACHLQSAMEVAGEKVMLPLRRDRVVTADSIRSAVGSSAHSADCCGERSTR